MVGPMHMQTVKVICIRVKRQLVQKLEWKQMDAASHLAFPANTVSNKASLRMSMREEGGHELHPLWG